MKLRPWGTIINSRPPWHCNSSGGPNAIGPRCQFYSDNAKELVNAARRLGWCAEQSTPYMSANNSNLERGIKHVEEGTRTILARSRLGPEWWPSLLNMSVTPSISEKWKATRHGNTGTIKDNFRDIVYHSEHWLTSFPQHRFGRTSQSLDHEEFLVSSSDGTSE